MNQNFWMTSIWSKFNYKGHLKLVQQFRILYIILPSIFNCSLIDLKDELIRICVVMTMGLYLKIEGSIFLIVMKSGHKYQSL